MRGSLGASDSALRLVPAPAALAIAFALALAGCGLFSSSPSSPSSPSPSGAAASPGASASTALGGGQITSRKAPPRVLVVRLEQVALRTSAWVELHSWLAASARASSELGDPELDAAALGYAGALRADERDEALVRTMNALEPCDDERCARAAVAGSPFASAYLAALPRFLASRWQERARVTRAAIDVARASFGDETEPLVARLAGDLAIDWPAAPPAVPLVADAPEPGRGAPMAPVLAARGGCLSRVRDETARARDARIVDCVLVHAAVRLESRSTLAVALGRELAARGKTSELSRAWEALVVHAVAVTVTAWEPKHASVLRRSAASVMPGAMEWLAREWPSRMRGEPVAALAKRYADALDGRPDAADSPKR